MFKFAYEPKFMALCNLLRKKCASQEGGTNKLRKKFTHFVQDELNDGSCLGVIYCIILTLFP